MELSEILNTREQAYLILIMSSALLIMCMNSLRKGFAAAIASLFEKSFLVIYLLNALYTVASIYLLKTLNFWDWSMLKDTILWFFLTAFPLIYGIATTKDVKIYFKTTLLDLVKFTAILEFVMGLYTFSLWVELGIAVFVVFLSGFKMFVRNPERYRKELNVIDGVNIAVIILLVAIEFQFIVFRTSLISQFLLPVFHSLLFVPFLYMLALYMRFEAAFAVMKIQIQPNSLLKYTKRLLMLNFFFNLKGLERWRIHIFRVHPKTKEDILVSIRHIKENQKNEKEKPLILPNEGWSPYLVKDFLIEEGIKIENYINYYDDFWGVTSYSKSIDDEVLNNSLIYGVYGNQHTATQIKLWLQLLNPAGALTAQIQLANMAAILYKKIFDQELNREITDALIGGNEIKMKSGIYEFKVYKVPYQARLGGYDLKFVITHHKHIDDEMD
jgi:hypothetical protein